VRILGEVNKEYVDLLRQTDHIYIEELRKHNLYDEVSQAFAALPPCRRSAQMNARSWNGCNRPAISEKRLSLTSGGNDRYQIPRLSYSTGADKGIWLP
jgi:hypothetical protein